MQSTSEKWLPAVGYEGIYEVSNHGRVRSVDRWVSYKDGRNRLYRGSEMKPQTRPDGHLTVDLVKNKRRKNRRVHQLVLEAFAGMRPEGTICCHWDDDPSNNRLENLRWSSYSENMVDRVRNNKHHNAIKSHCKRGHEFIEENIKPSSRPGQRQCLSCARMNYYVYMHPELSDKKQELSDSYFAALTSVQPNKH